MDTSTENLTSTDIVDYVEPLLKARAILKDTDFGLLVNDSKFETALIKLRLAGALLKETEMLLTLYQHRREELEVSQLTVKLRESIANVKFKGDTK